MTLAKVENGEITRYNVSEKQARVGLINFEGDYLAAGFYPQVGSPSSYDAAKQTQVGPTYAVVGETVERTWTIENKPIGVVRDEQKAKLAANRYELEIAGITVDGAEIDTSRASQSMLSGASISSARDEAKIFDWKGTNGWVSLDKTQLAAIVLALGDHIEELFSAERVASNLIDVATTVEAVLAVDITLIG